MLASRSPVLAAFGDRRAADGRKSSTAQKKESERQDRQTVIKYWDRLITVGSLIIVGELFVKEPWFDWEFSRTDKEILDFL